MHITSAILKLVLPLSLIAQCLSQSSGNLLGLRREQDIFESAYSKLQFGHSPEHHRRLTQSATGTASFLVEVANTDAIDTLCTELQNEGTTCNHKYYRVFNGFAAELSAGQQEALGQNSNVKALHPDVLVSTQQVPKVQKQKNAPWHLDRIDQQNLPLDGLYDHTLDGSGINVYILDTGIRKDHVEFQYSAANKALGFTGTRALHAYSVYGDNNSDDCYGHGTHVAGIVGGLTFGVAKNVTLHAVRCISCDGSGQASAVIAALDWLAANVKLPAIASMSLGAGQPDAVLDAATTTILGLGVTVVTAAGNYNNDACGISPAKVPGAITVAATDSSDQRWDYSNYGTCVDLYAPGVQVRSAMFYTTTANITASGTSMACPVVSGVSALYLQVNPAAVPAEVQAFIRGNAVAGVVQNALESTGSPNLLLQTDLTQVPTVTIAPEPLPPAVLYEGSFSATLNQTLTLGNVANTTVNYTVSAPLMHVSVTPLGVFGGWLSAAPAAGAVAPSSQSSILLAYDVSQNEFQGKYQAEVLLTTTARPVAKVLQATAYVFCADLQSVPQGGAHSVAFINFALVQDTRPTTSDWPSIAPEGPNIYARIAVRFSHPVGDLAAAALVVNEGAGSVESVVSQGPRGSMCSDFLVYAKVAFSPWDTPSTTLCLSLLGDRALDVFGTAFPDAKNCTTLDHRPVGRLYAPYMAMSSDGGALTCQQAVALIMVWSEPITGLETSQFTVTGPASASVVALKLLRGTSSYYHLLLNLPSAYIGSVSVTFTGQVEDASGNVNIPLQPLQFTRTTDSLLEPTSFRILKSPSLLALT
ncbi:probable extracellular serine proteinase at N-terminal half [Coccomyxa sp. Obi]|nr:probable extracellular serine proteinase at N-terminal half [Coccomyxa sp. Obi]